MSSRAARRSAFAPERCCVSPVRTTDWTLQLHRRGRTHHGLRTARSRSGRRKALALVVWWRPSLPLAAGRGDQTPRPPGRGADWQCSGPARSVDPAGRHTSTMHSSGSQRVVSPAVPDATLRRYPRCSRTCCAEGSVHTEQVDLWIRTARTADQDAIAGIFRRASLSNDGDRDNLFAHPELLAFDTGWTKNSRVRVAIAAGTSWALPRRVVSTTAPLSSTTCSWIQAGCGEVLHEYSCQTPSPLRGRKACRGSK